MTGRTPLVPFALIGMVVAQAAMAGSDSDSKPINPAPLVAPPRKPSPSPKPPASLEQPSPRPTPAPAPAPAPSSARAPSPLPPRPWLFLSTGAGVAVPFTFLRPGWEAGAEVRVPLDLLEGRTSLRLRAGAFQMGGQGPRLVPGRGYDPAFIQNRLGGQLELGADLTLLAAGPHQLSAGAAYAAQLVQDTFLVLNAQQSERGLGSAALASLTYRLDVGPGRLALSVRLMAGAAALGALAQVGTSSLTGASALLSYEHAFTTQENRP